MARKIETVVIEDAGRDQGKIFVITEMSAEMAERWAIRALLALTNAGLKLPDATDTAALATLADVGFSSLTKLEWFVVEPLLNEMWECVQFQPDSRKPNLIRPVLQGDNGDIEEVKTRIKLRMAVFKLHVAF